MSEGSAEQNLTEVFKLARVTRMNQGLETISEWSRNRAASDHNPDTTITMLTRKVQELDERSMSAGYRAVQAMAGEEEHDL